MNISKRDALFAGFGLSVAVAAVAIYATVPPETVPQRSAVETTIETTTTTSTTIEVEAATTTTTTEKPKPRPTLPSPTTTLFRGTAEDDGFIPFIPGSAPNADGVLSYDEYQIVVRVMGTDVELAPYAVVFDISSAISIATAVCSSPTFNSLDSFARQTTATLQITPEATYFLLGLLAQGTCADHVTALFDSVPS